MQNAISDDGEYTANVLYTQDPQRSYAGASDCRLHRINQLQYFQGIGGYTAPLMGKTDHRVKNSQEFATEMASVLIDEGECFVSHDVVSLFTNMPISEALEIIRNQLENDKRLKDRTDLEIDDIMELLEFVLTTTYFTFRGVIYQQRFGTAMGSPVSPIIANLFMEWLEQ